MAYAERRTLEIITALSAGTFGAIVAVDSLSHDVGWNANGPGAGYFPFRIGLLLILTGLLIARTACRSATGVFVTPDGFARSVSVFGPTVALAAAMFPLGCYVPSFVFLTWMMRRHGGAAWLRAAGTSLVAVVIISVIFERWFQVPLAKGPVEALLGFY
jgi:hypothetical protein